MISDVINQEMYTRIFILLTCVFMFSVQQANIRAYYKQLYGKIDDSRNGNIMIWGIVSMCALPLIGMFDESLWTQLHGYPRRDLLRVLHDLQPPALSGHDRGEGPV